nr:hypothetical protein [Tanacetum cinerariifolium]
DTDSEIDIMPPSRKIIKSTVGNPTAHTTSRRAKKVKALPDDGDYEEDAMFDAGDENISPNASPDSKLVLSSNVLKRSERILDP